MLYNSVQVHALKAIHQESDQEYILKGSVGKLFASLRGGLASDPVARVLNRKAGTCSDSNIAIHSATGVNITGPQRLLEKEN